MAEESILKLRADLAWVFALVWVAKAGRSGEPEPQVHYYLGIVIGAYSKGLKREVRLKARIDSEQEPSDTSVQVGAWHDRNIDFGSATFEYSTTFQLSPLRSWLLSPNRRLQYGWSSSESPNKRSPFVRDQR